MQRRDKKTEELREIPLPHGWQISAMYYGAWFLAMIFTTGASWTIRATAFAFLMVYAVLSVVAIIVFEMLRWRRDKQNEDHSPPST